MSNKIKISLENPKIRAIWETVLEARREVASWPAWKRGEYDAPATEEAPVSMAAPPEPSGKREG